MKPPRVILADDHRIVAEALSQLVAPYFDVVATGADGHALIEAALSFKPDAAVVDVAMPLLNGLEAGRQLRTRMPGLKLIFLRMNEDPELAAEAIRIGASGYVLKKCAGSELLHAMRLVLRGKSYIARPIARAIRRSSIHTARGKGDFRSLTPRQREVVQLLAEGKSMKEAADVLSVRTRTIAFHKYRVMRELGFETNAELLQFAVRDHIVVG
jgi:DNA-binding NarL/FixJ family response regulator